MSAKRRGRSVKSVRDAALAEHSLDDLFERFYRVKVAEGRAETTLNGYRENFGYFLRYLDEQGIPRDVRNVTTDLIRDYILYMMNDKVRFEGHRFKSDAEKTVGLSPVTINTRLKTLRVFFGYLASEGLIESDPMKGVKNVTEPEEAPDILTVDELKRLLDACDLRLYSDFRDYTLMHVLLDTFLRTNKVLSLKRDDIDFELNTITVRATVAKSRRTRILPISKRTANLLRELLKENEAFDSEYVFLSNYGEQLTADHFRHRLKKYAERTGIKRRVYPYLFRHTGATMFLENGGDIRHLQLILGHKDMRVIKRYTHLSDRSIRKQHELYSPLNYVIGKHNKPRKIKRDSD